MLGPCLPNPARGASSISYQVLENGRVSLKIYDICGRLVRTMADNVMQPGLYRAAWDGTDEHGLAVSPGVYFIRLDAVSVSITGRLTLVR